MITEVIPFLYVGDDNSVDEFLELHPEGTIIHAAKDPWHRNALGYTGRGAPKDDPEYLIAVRQEGKRVYLNMVDAHDSKYIPMEIFEAVTEHVTQAHKVNGEPVLIHCNQGHSRSPALAMWYLRSIDELDSNLNEALAEFQGLYDSQAEFGTGIADFLAENW